MSKTQLTEDIELRFIDYLYDKKYELGVRECAIGRRKKYGIVDILSYHGKPIRNGRGRPITRETTWRCYEIKTSKQDFYSPNKWTFVGDYNYFVVPDVLYDEIKKDIPKGIGCFTYNGRVNGFKNVKRSVRKTNSISESQLMHDYLVSNNRDARRWVKSTCKRNK